MLVSGCENPPLDTDWKQKELIGIWQDLNVTAAGWTNVYRFLPNREFVFHTNQMDCESRNREFSGTWSLDNDLLILQISNEKVVAGGKLVDAMGSCGTESEIDGGTIEEHAISPAKLVKFKISNIVTDRGKNKFDEAYEMKMVEIDGTKYWKFDDDPSKY